MGDDQVQDLAKRSNLNQSQLQRLLALSL